ncbi:MAG: protocatechuate 4,5-dioxygenase subunit alpha [Burkholderiales bacterium]
MSAYNDAFEDIPGTTVFDMRQARRGYHLNMFCMSLMNAENRAAFKLDQKAYLEKFPLSDEQREAVIARDYNRLLSLGGNIYFLGKISSADGQSFIAMYASMTPESEQEFTQMMLQGGRPVAGNRSKSEEPDHG